MIIRRAAAIGAISIAASVPLDPVDMVSPEEKIYAADLAGAIAKAGVAPTLEGRSRQDALPISCPLCHGYGDVEDADGQR